MSHEQHIAPLATAALRRGVLLACGLLVGRAVAAQTAVVNDDIAHRLPLLPEQPRQSRTDGCTVQRACVDERLTGKCITYHNDQWFAFTPPADGRYYVNIGGQQCRDVRGVQLVVSQGTPCAPATYRILACVSLGNQDDVFVPLDNLQAGQEYLLDVDGYLHDFCRFGIEVSRTAKGLPLTPQGRSSAQLTGQVAQLSWTLPDSLAADDFDIWRREAHDFRSTRLHPVPAQRDAYGRWQPSYALRDTLPASATPIRYEYRIVARRAEAAVLVGQPVVSSGPIRAAADGTILTPGRFITLPLAEYPWRADLTVIVLDAATGRVLQHAQFQRAKQYAQQSKIPVYGFQQQGIKKVLVRIRHQAGGGSPSTREISYPL